MVKELYYEDAKVGDEAVTGSITVTEAHILGYSDISGDHTPIHVDEEAGRKGPFGERVAQGLFGLAVTDGLKTQADYRFVPGKSLGWTWDFLKPIKIGDTLHVKFRIGSMRHTKKPDWGIVVMPCELINQHGEVIQHGEHRLMVHRRPAKA
jgi:acyl dehydratase